MSAGMADDQIRAYWASRGLTPSEAVRLATEDLCGCRFDGKLVARERCPAHRYSRMSDREVVLAVLREHNARVEAEDAARSIELGGEKK